MKRFIAISLLTVATTAPAAACAWDDTDNYYLFRAYNTREFRTYVDEVTIGADGKLNFVRRHNGDQDHQGRHARISVGDWKILHIQLYEY